MNEPKAVRYQRLRRRVRLAEVASGAALLTFVGGTSGARRLADEAAAWAMVFPPAIQTGVAAAGFILVLALSWESLILPVVLYAGMAVERRYGRSGDSAATLLASHLRTAAIRLPALATGAAVIVAAMRLAGDLWWLAAGACCTVLWAVALRLGPMALARLGEIRPIERRSLMSGLRELARRSGLEVTSVVEWHVEAGARATALVAGMGRRCRVFVASEVLRDWSDDEIAVVVAHELGHHLHRDLWRDLMLNAGVLSLCFGAAALALGRLGARLGVSGTSDLAALPLVALATGLAWLIARPVRLAHSRAQERRADEFALKLTGEPGAFGTAVRRLSERHLAEHRPSALIRWFFHRHPPVGERLAMAERFVKAEGKRQKAEVRNKLSRVNSSI